MYRFVGRVEREPSGQVKYAWSGTGFVANFRGTGATVLLADDKNEHQVIVDGKILDKVVTRRKTTRYPLVSGLPSGDHQIELYRRTEALFGNTTFLGLEIEGGALIAEDSKPRRRIELIGDSISCGYGNLGDSVNCGFSADTENHYESYGATLARTFNAEISTVAWSGRGIVRNFNGEIGEKMGALYDRVLPSESSSKWSADVPYDVVIINLGTNDFSTDPDPSEEEFATAYGTLLEKVRKNSPRSFVLCTIGPMLGGDDLEKAERSIRLAVERRRNAGDLRVLAYRMKTTNDDPGCDWHPSVPTHQRIADELAVPIRAAMNW
jgi:lysophospholipase L1-like esterase